MQEKNLPNKKRILGICGSPRKGNSEFALKFFFDNIKGIEKEIVLLRKVKVNYRDSLFSEKIATGYLKDGLDKVLTKMRQADIIVISTPTYFDMPPSLLKILIDRTSVFYYKSLLKNKKVVLIACGEAKLSEGSIERNMANLIAFCKTHKMKVVGKIMFSTAKTSAEKNIKLKGQLKEVAKKIK